MLNGALLLATLIALLYSGGCSGGIENIRDEDFTQGCVVVDASAGLGALGNTGNALIYKLKCSPTLPPGYKLEIDRPGFKARVEVKDNGEAQVEYEGAL